MQSQIKFHFGCLWCQLWCCLCGGCGDARLDMQALPKHLVDVDAALLHHLGARAGAISNAFMISRLYTSAAMACHLPTYGGDTWAADSGCIHYASA